MFSMTCTVVRVRALSKQQLDRERPPAVPVRRFHRLRVPLAHPGPAQVPPAAMRGSSGGGPAGFRRENVKVNMGNPKFFLKYFFTYKC